MLKINMASKLSLRSMFVTPCVLSRIRTNYSSLSSRWFNFNVVKYASTLLNTPTVVLADRLENKATPWLMLPPQVDPTTGDKLDCFYSLADSQTVKLNRKKSLKVPDTAICMASTLGSWLGFANPKDASLYLSNPFSNDVVELPSLATLPRVMAVERDSTGSILRYKVAHPEFDGPPSLVEPESMAYYMTYIALSKEDPRDYYCVAMAVQGEISHLAYSHIGKTQDPDNNNNNNDNNNNVWHGLQEDYVLNGLRNRVVYCRKNKLFYSIFQEVGIKAFDVERDRGRRTKKVAQLHMMRIDCNRRESLPKWLKNLEPKCLVEYYLLTIPSNGDLWLIVRYLNERRDNDDTSIPPHKTIHFDVFRVTYQGELERVTYLEDRSIFIGSNQSFCVKASDCPEIRPNSIYFTDDIHMKIGEWGHDMGIFDMKNGDITQFYPYQDEQEEKNVPFTTPLFWISPPPSTC